MAQITITLENNINNTSFQIGDDLYYVDYSEVAGIDNTTSTPTKIGTVISFTSDTVDVDGVVPPKGAFLMFSKNTVINDTSLTGYFAKVKLENDSTDHAEIYRLTSSVGAR